MQNITIREHLLSTFPEFAELKHDRVLTSGVHLYDPAAPIWDMEMPYQLQSSAVSQGSIIIPKNNMPHRDLVYYLAALNTAKNTLDTLPVWKTILHHLDITWCWLPDHEVEELLLSSRLKFLDLFPSCVWEDSNIQSLMREQLLRIFHGQSGQTIDDLYDCKNLYQWLVLSHHYMPWDNCLRHAFDLSISHLPETEKAILYYAIGERHPMWSSNPDLITQNLETHVITTRYLPIQGHPLFFDAIGASIRHSIVNHSYDLNHEFCAEIANVLMQAKDEPIVSIEGYSRFCAVVGFCYLLEESANTEHRELYRSCFERHPEGLAYKQHVETCAKLRLDPLVAVESWKKQHIPAIDLSSTFEP